MFPIPFFLFYYKDNKNIEATKIEKKSGLPSIQIKKGNY